MGQAIIENSQIRSGISRIEQLQLAARTFKQRYDCIPGDCAYASRFFTGWAGTNGNGNGIVDGTTSNTVVEWTPFWQHVNAAGYFNVTCNQTSIYDWCDPPFMGTNSAISVSGGTTSDCNPWGNPLLCAKPGMNQIGIHYPGGGNVYALTPSVAYQIDSKIDDGFPTTGNYQASGRWYYGAGDNSYLSASSGSSGNVCINSSTTPASYYTSNTSAICNMIIPKAGF